MTIRVESIQKAEPPSSTYINGVDWRICLRGERYGLAPPRHIKLQLSWAYTDAEMREVVRKLDPEF